MVTTDIELADLSSDRSAHVAAARSDLSHIADAATVLGASTVRLLATRAPDRRLQRMDQVLSACPRLEVVIELHHPKWFAPAAADIIRRSRVGADGVALLIDSAQVHAAGALGYDVCRLSGLMELATMVHLSDTGHGLDGEGHSATIVAARAATLRGQQLEAGFEWTGAERTGQQCLRRFRAARSRWRKAWRYGGGGDR
jgi:hypothetical protein